jgi:ribonuclease P/MRP protein subunit RPP40
VQGYAPGPQQHGAGVLLNEHKLEVTEEERDIGVIVSKNLKPASQCKKAARTAQTVLSQISRAFHYRDRHVFIRLYVQYVRPHLEFAVPAWSPWLEADKEVLEKVQRRAIQMVSGLKAHTYEDRLKGAGPHHVGGEETSGGHGTD